MTIDVYARLRIETCAMLGFSDVGTLTPLQSLKLDLACVLRLELDRAAALQARGEAIDIKALTVAAEALERLLRPAEVVVAGADQHSDAREALEALMEGQVAANEVTEATRVQELEREVSDLREQLARSRAGAAPSAPAHVTYVDAGAGDGSPPVSVPMGMDDPNERAKRAESERIKAIATTRAYEPWRNYYETGRGVHSIPRDF
jgi:hypothetical protein